MIIADLSSWANVAQIASVVVPTVSAIVIWKLHNCRVPWCHRVGKIGVEGTNWKVCEKHHRHRHHEHLQRLHFDFLERD